MDNRKAEI